MMLNIVLQVTRSSILPCKNEINSPERTTDDNCFTMLLHHLCHKLLPGNWPTPETTKRSPSSLWHWGGWCETLQRLSSLDSVKLDLYINMNIRIMYALINVYIPPGARVRPPTNYWVSYQPTIGYLTNQLLGILPTNYWVSDQPTIGYLTNQLLGILPTNYWVSDQPTIGYLTSQLLGILPTNYWVSYQPTYNIPSINFPPPPGNPCF